MKIWNIVAAYVGENQANGYNPSGEVVASFKNYDDAKVAFKKQIDSEMLYSDEYEIELENLSENEVLIINRGEDYAVNIKLQSSILQ